MRIRIPLGEEVHGTSLAVYVDASPEGQKYESRSVPATCTGDLILDVFERCVRFGRPIELDFWFQATSARELTRPETIEWFYELHPTDSGLGPELYNVLSWLAGDCVTVVNAHQLEMPLLIALVAADSVLEQKLVEYYPRFVERHRGWIDSRRVVALCTTLGVLASTWSVFAPSADRRRLGTFSTEDTRQCTDATAAAREMRELVDRLRETAARVGPTALPVWRQVAEATIACYEAETVRLEQIVAGHAVHQVLAPGE